ncbi:MAG: hypothetical protein ACTSVA_05790 [Candidatus Njordarchaeales archaeon]
MMDVLLKKIKHIVSDGDWDGVVATALLIRFARKHGIEPIIEYPHPAELKERSFENVVAVEITPTKTKVVNSVIIDHHEKIEGFGNIWFFDENARSVAELVARIVKETLSRDLMEAVSNIDQGLWDANELTKTLFLAFQVDPGRFPRLEITYRLANGDEKWVIEWADKKSHEAKGILLRAEKLAKEAEELIPNSDIVYFIYTLRKDDGARRLALLKLERLHKIAISLGVENNRFVTGTIATYNKDIDLREIFEKLRKEGYSAGGRRNVGGFQARNEISVEKVIKDLREVFRRWLEK